MAPIVTMTTVTTATNATPSSFIPIFIIFITFTSFGFSLCLEDQKYWDVEGISDVVANADHKIEIFYDCENSYTVHHDGRGEKTIEENTIDLIRKYVPVYAIMKTSTDGV